MAFQEKSAWLMSLSLILAGLYYYSTVSGLSTELGELASPALRSVVIYTVLLCVLAIIGHILIAVLSPKEANAALDERERVIFARAGHYSGLAMGAGVVLFLGVYQFYQNGDVLFYGVFGSLMLGQLLEYLARIVLYRWSL